MNPLAALKEKLMIKPNVEERERVAVVIKGVKKEIKPRAPKIKAAKVIQRRAVIRYNNPARPNVRARHLREISELKNLNLNKEIKNKIKLLEFGKRK